MRKIKRKKERRYLTPLLFILNVFIWGIAIHLWMQDIDVPPQITDNFAVAADIYIPEVMQPGTFHTNATLTYEDVNVQIYSNHALLINLDTGEVLFDHRGHERVYPASITKIMTVLVGLEHAKGDEWVVYDEIITLSEVLHGLILRSDEDAATLLVYHVADSEEEFVNLMNETARQLDMDHTHFTNASGLHHDNHYTTAYDIALLLEYAFTHRRFREIFTTPIYSFINSTGTEQLMQSIMFQNIEEAAFNGGEILGGTTGFTPQAGLCLVAIATNGVHEFALITFVSPTDETTPPAHIRDAFAIFEYFFSVENGIIE